MKKNSIIQGNYELLIFYLLKLLNVNCTLFLKSFSHRRFIKLLSASQLFNDTSLFKFSF